MVVRDTVHGDTENKLKWRTTDCEDSLILISGGKNMSIFMLQAKLEIKLRDNLEFTLNFDSINILV